MPASLESVAILLCKEASVRYAWSRCKVSSVWGMNFVGSAQIMCTSGPSGGKSSGRIFGGKWLTTFWQLMQGFLPPAPFAMVNCLIAFSSPRKQAKVAKKKNQRRGAPRASEAALLACGLLTKRLTEGAPGAAGEAALLAAGASLFLFVCSWRGLTAGVALVISEGPPPALGALDCAGARAAGKAALRIGTRIPVRAKLKASASSEKKADSRHVPS